MTLPGLWRAHARIPDALGVVEHINRLGNPAQHWKQHQQVQQESETVFMGEVGCHITHGAQSADDRGTGQRHLGDCPGKTEIEREIAEQRRPNHVTEDSHHPSAVLLRQQRIRRYCRSFHEPFPS
jgi:hypothetical protein